MSIHLKSLESKQGVEGKEHPEKWDIKFCLYKKQYVLIRSMKEGKTDMP